MFTSTAITTWYFKSVPKITKQYFINIIKLKVIQEQKIAEEYFFIAADR